MKDSSLLRLRTNRRRCSESAASKPETWRSPWERAPSWTSTRAANHTRLWQVGCGNHVAFSGKRAAICTEQTDPIEGAPPLQVSILWWAGRSAPSSFTWLRATPQTRAPPSNGLRSLVGRRLFVFWSHLQWIAQQKQTHSVRPSLLCHGRAVFQRPGHQRYGLQRQRLGWSMFCPVF